MKRVLRAFLVTMVVLSAGCDPGMTIRQIKSSGQVSNGGGAPNPQLAIDVDTTHPLIGETWYAPRVTITNPFESPVTVTSVDLIILGATCAEKHPQPGIYPLVVLPGETKVLPVMFDLHDDVRKTFRKPAQLRVSYIRNGEEEIDHAVIVGGPLDFGARQSD